MPYYDEWEYLLILENQKNCQMKNEGTETIDYVKMNRIIKEEER